MPHQSMYEMHLVVQGRAFALYMAPELKTKLRVVQLTSCALLYGCGNPFDRELCESRQATKATPFKKTTAGW